MGRYLNNAEIERRWDNQFFKIEAGSFKTHPDQVPQAKGLTCACGGTGYGRLNLVAA